MEVTYTAKIVTKSRPFLIKEGNTWIADAVYRKGNGYMTRKVVAPNINYGPFEIGEEVELQDELSDIEAPEWMIRIYKDPGSFKKVMKEKEEEERKAYNEDIDDGKNEHTKTNPLTFILTIMVIAAIGMILFLMITGKW